MEKITKSLCSPCLRGILLMYQTDFLYNRACFYQKLKQFESLPQSGYLSTIRTANLLEDKPQYFRKKPGMKPDCGRTQN